MSKASAIARIARDYARADRLTTFLAKRAVAAAREIGLTDVEIVELMQELEFANADGSPWGGMIKKVWPDK